jgi:hypothetical protein
LWVGLSCPGETGLMTVVSTIGAVRIPQQIAESGDDGVDVAYEEEIIRHFS